MESTLMRGFTSISWGKGDDVRETRVMRFHPYAAFYVSLFAGRTTPRERMPTFMSFVPSDVFLPCALLAMARPLGASHIALTSRLQLYDRMDF
jgi:hypothetical protein